jgi:anti-sigma factor RsiW
MNHRKVFDSVCDFIDGELDDETCQELKKHVAACPKCRIYVDSLRKTIVLYKVNDKAKKVPVATRKRLYATIALKTKKAK